MNLIDAEWIPVRRASGARCWIAPWQLTDDIDGDAITALDAARPDFNGALIQFLIGLVQTTTTMDSLADWEDLMSNPPKPETLRAQFETVRFAFEFDGEGPRFLQDFTIKSEKADCRVEGLLLEAPGKNTLKENRDLFFKRRSADAMCVNCAAAAIFTLQSSATSGGGGGDGHFTSIRGGGPLTTIIQHTPLDSSIASQKLWSDVWINVRTKTDFLADCDSGKAEPHQKFPWLIEIDQIRKKNLKNSETGQKDKFKLQSSEAHPAHMYFGMPRRIWLDFNHTRAGQCKICGRQQADLVRQYVTISGGIDYGDTWRHPLTPYYRIKPTKPSQPTRIDTGGIGYRHWLGWVLGMADGEKKTEPAKVVLDFLQYRYRSGQYRIRAFGYETDKKAKVRCWYESTFPIYSLCDRRVQDAVMDIVGKIVSAGEWAAERAKDGIEDAWFPKNPNRKEKLFRPKLDLVATAFRSRTERAFYSSLQEVVAKAQITDAFEVTLPIRMAWRQSIIRSAQEIFDEFVAPGDVSTSNPQRIANAHDQLEKKLGGRELFEILGLPFPVNRKV